MNKKYSLKLAGCLIAGVIAFNSQASYCMEDYYYDTIEYIGNSKEIKELVNKANELQSETMSTSNSSFVPGVEEFRKESKKLNEQVRNNILNANLTWDINNDKAKVDTYIKIAKMLRNATNLASMLSDNLDPNDNTICHHFYARFVKGLFKDIKIKNSEIYKLANGKTDDFKKFNELLEGYSHRSYLYTKIGEIFGMWRDLLQCNEFYNSQFGPKEYVNRSIKEIHKILEDVNANGNKINYISYYVLLDNFIQGLQHDMEFAQNFKKKFDNYKVQVAPRDNLEINPQGN